MPRAIALVLLLLVGLSPAAARAQAESPSAASVAEARSLFERGLAAADAERWGEAVELFRRARDVVERPSIVFNLGQALMRLGQSSEARAALERFIVIADPAADRADADVARRLLGELGATQGTLELAVEPADSLVELDGAPVEGTGAERVLTLDPGRHRLSVTADGYRPDRFEVSVLAGSRERRSTILERLPTRPATLVVHANENSEVRIDGLLAGRGEVEREVDPGAHRVLVVDGGTTVLERELTLSEGERVVLDAIVSRGGSVAEEPWLWVIVALAVVGAGVGVGAGIYVSQPPADPVLDYAGTRGVVLAGLRFE